MKRWGIATALILALALLAVLPCRGADEKPEAQYGPMKAAFQADKAAFGSKAVLALEFSLPEGAVLDKPPKLDGMEPDRLLEWKRTGSGLELTLLVNSLDALSVDSLRLAYKAKDGKVHWLQSEPVQIPVDNGLPEDPSKLQPRPVKGLIPGQPPWIFWLKTGLAALAVLCMFGVIAWLIIRSRKKQAEGPPAVPPHEIALREMDFLEGQWEALPDDKEGYFRLSSIVRAYMEAIRSFPASELTTEEIRARISKEEDRPIAGLLREADMVKFAKARIAAQTRKQHLQMARDYVKQTMPVDTGEPPVIQAEIVQEPEAAAKP